MSSDPLRDLERQLVAAADRQILVFSLPRRPRRRFAVALAAVVAMLVLAAVALAASGLLSSGAPLTLPPGIPVNPDSGIGAVKLATVRLLPIAVPDPGGGPPWGLRYVATTRGLGCLQTDRLVRGMLGVIGEDDAFANDGRFHALPAGLLDGPFPCGSLDARGDAFGGSLVYAVPASGLITPTHGQTGCEVRPVLPPGATPPPHVPAQTGPFCPPQDERAIYFGMAGPDATSVTYVAGGRAHTVATVGRQGAYLIVLDRTGPLLSDGYSPLAGAGGGPIRSIHYRSGYVCVLSTRQLSSQTCPHVGQILARRPRVTAADVAAPLAAALTIGRYGPQLTVSFTARVAVTDASSAYEISIRFPGSEPRCGSILSGPLIADNRKGQREHFDQPTEGCTGTFRGTVYYQYGGNTDGLPYDFTGPALTVGRFTVNVP
jgi:hypothetical protein